MNFDLSSTAPAAWLDWVLDLSMRGVPRDLIIERCCDKGLPKDSACRLVSEIEHNPLFRISILQREQKAKADSLLMLLASLQYKRDCQEGIVRVPELSSDAFYADFFYGSRPAILTNIAQPLMAKRSWQLERLASDFGSELAMVSVGSRWAQRPPYAVPCGHVSMRFAEFVNQLGHDRLNDSIYITGEDRLFSAIGFERLFEDAVFDCAILDSTLATPDTVKAWIGPKGTYTPLHHDRVNILMCQAHGSKRIHLCPPGYLPQLKNDFGCYSPLSFERHREEPSLVGSAHCLSVEISAGEALFLPAGWWHEVVALGPSVTITYDNFAVSDKEAASWMGVYWIRNCDSL